VPLQGLYFRKRKPDANSPDSPTKTSWFRRLPSIDGCFKVHRVGGNSEPIESGPKYRNCSARPIGCRKGIT